MIGILLTSLSEDLYFKEKKLSREELSPRKKTGKLIFWGINFRGWRCLYILQE